MPRCLGTSGSVRAMRTGLAGEGGALDVHLLSVDDQSSPSRTAPRAEGGEVGSGARLAEQLAPDLLAGPQRAQKSPLLLLPCHTGGWSGAAIRGRCRCAGVGVGENAAAGQFGVLTAWRERGAANPPRPLRVVHPGRSGVEPGGRKSKAFGGSRWMRGQQFPSPRRRSSAASVMRAAPFSSCSGATSTRPVVLPSATRCAASAARRRVPARSPAAGGAPMRPARWALFVAVLDPSRVRRCCTGPGGGRGDRVVLHQGVVQPGAGDRYRSRSRRRRSGPRRRRPGWTGCRPGRPPGRRSATGAPAAGGFLDGGDDVPRRAGRRPRRSPARGRRPPSRGRRRHR